MSPGLTRNSPPIAGALVRELARDERVALPRSASTDLGALAIHLILVAPASTTRDARAMKIFW
jgi:hypothetical protein